MNRAALPRLTVLSTLALALAGCPSDSGSDDESSTTDTGTDDATDTESGSETGTDTETDTGLEEPDPEVAWPTLPCDSLVPDYCLYPFPNNVFTVDDGDTETGRRVALQADSLPTKNNNTIDPAPFNLSDGFSAGQAMLTYLPNAAPTGLPTWQDLDASLADDCPTVIINAETGERVPHFSEIDVSLAGDEDGTFMIRPVERLADNTRYIVAIRNVQDDSGEVIEASPEFAALRDLQPTEDADVEARRPLYADIFQRLGDAGVARDDLQIAWDFTTASLDNNTGAVVHMRDDALGQYPEGSGPTYTITDVDPDWESAEIAFKITGMIEVPLYLDDPGVGSSLVMGADGLPEQQGTAEYEFTVLIPNSAVDPNGEPAKLLQYGHGLLGSHTELQTSHMRSFINENNYILFGTDWIGMASPDALFIAGMLTNGTMHEFVGVADRLQQSMVNFTALTRMMKTEFANDPMFGQYIDPSDAYYLGISQGGIFGGTFLAISQDIERGCVGVPGQPYNILLNRSVDFDMYFALLQQGYSDSRDLQILLAGIQMLWDRAEPSGYTHTIASNALPDTPEHEVLIRAAIGDHQVTTLGAHIMARAMGATHLDTGIREVWGLDAASGSNMGTTYVEYDFGLPEDPLQNVPQEACEDPHGKLRRLEEARQQLDTFFQTGEVVNFCVDETCSFPDMSGC